MRDVLGGDVLRFKQTRSIVATQASASPLNAPSHQAGAFVASGVGEPMAQCDPHDCVCAHCGHDVPSVPTCPTCGCTQLPREA
jgi:hypothetical protein